MKRFLESVAEYEMKAMEAMLSALEKAPRDLLSKNVGAYYKSIDGIVAHAAWALVLWLKRFSGFGSYPCLTSSALLTKPIDEIGDIVKGDRAKAAAILREADALVRRFIAELPDPELTRQVRYTSTSGQELERELWQTVFQILNHGTHHRGEISAILDMNGIANDFNGFLTHVS